MFVGKKIGAVNEQNKSVPFERFKRDALGAEKRICPFSGDARLTVINRQPADRFRRAAPPYKKINIYGGLSPLKSSSA